MISKAVVIGFLKTAFYGCSLIGRSETVRRDVKHRWGQMVLRNFGYTIHVHGTPPPDESCILVGNHISYLDIPTLMAVFPDVVFIAKQDMRHWPIIGPSAAAAGTIFVSRESSNGRVVRDQIITALKGQNKKVVVFPSGTTSLHEHKPWKKGIFKIAQQAGLPIKLFRLEYSPLRASAYVDDDNLLASMSRLSKIQNKTATLHWMDQFSEIQDPVQFSADLRQKVIDAGAF